MRTTVMIHGQTATIDRGTWTTDSRWLGLMLPRCPTPEGYLPDPDYARAQEAAIALGGSILAYAGPPANDCLPYRDGAAPADFYDPDQARDEHGRWTSGGGGGGDQPATNAERALRSPKEQLERIDARIKRYEWAARNATKAMQNAIADGKMDAANKAGEDLDKHYAMLTRIRAERNAFIQEHGEHPQDQQGRVEAHPETGQERMARVERALDESTQRANALWQQLQDATVRGDEAGAAKVREAIQAEGAKQEALHREWSQADQQIAREQGRELAQRTPSRNERVAEAARQASQFEAAHHAASQRLNAAQADHQEAKRLYDGIRGDRDRVTERQREYTRAGDMDRARALQDQVQTLQTQTYRAADAVIDKERGLREAQIQVTRAAVAPARAELNPGGRDKLDAVVQAFGDKLHISEITHDAVKATVKDLGLMPTALVDRVIQNGHGGTYIGAKPLPELDDNERFRHERPRGWTAGKTWDQVGGVYSSATHQVTVAHGDQSESGSVSTILHELGHALGAVTNRTGTGANERWTMTDDSRSAHAANRRLYDKLNPYYKQGGPGGAAGTQEMFAESVAIHLKLGNGEVARRFDAPYARWLKGVLQ